MDKKYIAEDQRASQSTYDRDHSSIDSSIALVKQSVPMSIPEAFKGAALEFSRLPVAQRAKYVARTSGLLVKVRKRVAEEFIVLLRTMQACEMASQWLEGY